MQPQWKADFEITEDEAVRLLTRQFPALAPIASRLLGIGWDNCAYVINEAFVFRFPRRHIAVPLIEREIRILPMLVPVLPLPIPNPIFVGTPESEFPYPFAGYSLLPGVTACRRAWTEAERGKNAVALARFLKALHHLPIEETTRSWAPQDDIRRADLAWLAPRVLERLAALPEMPYDLDRSEVMALVERLATTAPYSGPTCWVHGDLYARHLLANEEHDICGLIDWGDVHLGDPAIDLAIAYSFLPPEARPLFQETYGPIEETAWDRARFRALHYGAILIRYGTDIDDAAIRKAGEYALFAGSR